MKVFAITASALALMLSSCTTLTPGTDPSTVITQTNSVITQIIAGSVKACAYQPDAAAITNLLSSFVPGAAPVTGIVNQVVKAICDQITANKGGRMGVAVTPVVNGVPITGHFVQGVRRR